MSRRGGGETPRRPPTPDQELFPRMVRRSVLIALWMVLAATAGGLLVITVALGGSP